MDPATTGAVIDAVARHWSLDENCEITLEANPNSVEAARFAGYAKAGVGRVSLGLQALDDAALKQLGRAHSVREGLAALDIAQAHFGRVSFDLIYDRPGQTRPAWEAELTRALGFGTEHLSLYQLTIEPSTAFARLHADGKLVLPDADTSADLFEMTQAMTAAAGLPAYEVSNHARPGAASRHNLAYWRYDDYVGVGPGAHGRRLATATERHKKPENWIAALAATGSGLNVETPLDAGTRATEALLMGTSDDCIKPFSRLVDAIHREGTKVFIQLFHPGWDHHGSLPMGFEIGGKEVDQASAALITDLKQRGMLKDTLVIFGSEFGRTSYSQGGISKDRKSVV